MDFIIPAESYPPDLLERFAAHPDETPQQLARPFIIRWREALSFTDLDGVCQGRRVLSGSVTANCSPPQRVVSTVSRMCRQVGKLDVENPRSPARSVCCQWSSLFPAGDPSRGNGFGSGERVHRSSSSCPDGRPGGAPRRARSSCRGSRRRSHGGRPPRPCAAPCEDDPAGLAVDNRPAACAALWLDRQLDVVRCVIGGQRPRSRDKPGPGRCTTGTSPETGASSPNSLSAHSWQWRGSQTAYRTRTAAVARIITAMNAISLFRSRRPLTR
jgi:hypothetical protein